VNSYRRNGTGKVIFLGCVASQVYRTTIRKIQLRLLGEYGRVLTEHLGDDEQISRKDSLMSDREIHDRDLEWILESDLVVAEVTVPSLGVGYEIGRAIENRKPILCLFREGTEKRLSAMIAGSPGVEVCSYTDPADLSDTFRQFVTRNAHGRIF